MSYKNDRPIGVFFNKNPIKHMVLVFLIPAILIYCVLLNFALRISPIDANFAIALVPSLLIFGLVIVLVIFVYVKTSYFSNIVLFEDKIINNGVLKSETIHGDDILRIIEGKRRFYQITFKNGKKTFLAIFSLDPKDHEKFDPFLKKYAGSA